MRERAFHRGGRLHALVLDVVARGGQMLNDQLRVIRRVFDDEHAQSSIGHRTTASIDRNRLDGTR